MTDHLSFDTLCDYADGSLDAAAEAAARRHLDECAECMKQKDALAALDVAAAALPRSIAPPEGLWNDIRRELKPRRFGRMRLLSWGLPQLAAAAMIVAVSSSALTVIVLRGRDAAVSQKRMAVGAPATPPLGEQLPVRLAAAEIRYNRSVEALQMTLDQKRDSLSASTIATVERSLRVADSAIAEARAALTQDPSNGTLAALFASNYERKIDLLRRATLLEPRT